MFDLKANLDATERRELSRFMVRKLLLGSIKYRQ
jgi:hypothetical protein